MVIETLGPGRLLVHQGLNDRAIDIEMDLDVLVIAKSDRDRTVVNGYLRGKMPGCTPRSGKETRYPLG